MRPGHYCPGNLSDEEMQRIKEEASMRPGHYCPGNIYAREFRRHPTAGFNEAGALLPRKLRFKRVGKGVHDTLQ